MDSTAAGSHPGRSGFRYRSPQGLTCVMACVFMLAWSRWGAHLRIPPVYIGDLLLAVAIVHELVSRALAGRRARTGAARHAHPGWILGLLFAWAVLRFAFAGDHGIVALRDLAPYGYAVIAFFSARAFARSTEIDRQRTVILIEIALVIHLLWVIPALLLYRGPEPLPAGEGPTLFSIRADTDGTVLAITACLYLMRYLRRGGLCRLVVVVLSLGAMFSMTSRASLLAAVTGLALTLWYYLVGDSQHATSSRRQVALVGAAPIALVVLSLVVPQMPASTKLLASIGVVYEDNDIVQTGLNTQRARSAAWRRLLAYTRETPLREVAGVGFGPQVMIDSGASIALINDDDPAVRSPHNFLLGTFARLGIVGLGLLGLVCIQMIAGIWRLRRFAAANELVLLAGIVPPMLLITATVGVVLEAPFGAIPFFWFLGILLSKPQPSKGGPDSADDDQADLRLHRPPSPILVGPDPLPSPVS